MTRGQLKSLFKELIGDQGDAVYDDTKMELLLYTGVQIVQDWIELLDEMWFLESTSTNMTGSETTLALPSNFRSLIQLRRTDNTTSVLLERISVILSTSLLLLTIVEVCIMPLVHLP
jgi:hypothetical protein